MAKGAYPFASSWGLKSSRGSGHWSMLRDEVRLSQRTPSIFIDWWLSDTSTPGSSGNSNFFLFFRTVAILAIGILNIWYWTGSVNFF